MKKRKGIIRIPRESLKLDSDSYQISCAVFSKFIPLYIMDNPTLWYVEYYGISNSFQEVEEIVTPPLYEIQIAVCDNRFAVDFILQK